MSKNIDTNKFICCYCHKNVKTENLNSYQVTCNHCFHDLRIYESKNGFKVLQKTRQDKNNRNYKIDKALYKDIIYTITDAELLKFNFIENKLHFEDFFEVCHKKQFSVIRNTIIYKAYILGLPNVEILNFFKENGAKISVSIISYIIKTFNYETKNQRIRNNLQRISH